MADQTPSKDGTGRPASRPKDKGPARPPTPVAAGQSSAARIPTSAGTANHVDRPDSSGGAILAALALSVPLIIGGSVIRFLQADSLLGTSLQGLGGFCAMAAVALGRSSNTLPWIKAGGEAKDWTRLKVLSLLLNLLALMSVVVLIGAFLLQLGIVERSFDLVDVARASGGITSLLVFVLAITYIYSFRARIRHEEGAVVGWTHAGLVSGAVIALVAAMAVGTTPRISDTAAADTAFLIQTAMTLVALDLFVIRTLPNAFVVLGGEESNYQGETYFDRSKSVFLPIIVAVALLLVGFLGFVVIGAGPSGLFTSVATNPFILGAAVVVLLAIAGAFILAARLAQKEDKPELYQKKDEVGDRRSKQILLGSAVLGVPLLLLAAVEGFGFTMLGLAEGAWVDLIAGATLILVGPYGFYAAHESRRIKNLEDRFPDFLRDIASSHRGGLTLHGSVTIAAKGEYGSLTSHIKRMADQMAWNVAFSEALTRFAESVRTPLVRRAVYLILEADRSGGNTADVLFAAARDARELKTQETDRQVSLGLYTIVIYITFLVFLFVAAVLYGQFVPQIIETAEATENLNTGGAGSPIGGGGAATLPEYRAFYYMAALVQGAGGGIVAGVMSRGQALMGLQHSFWMVLISFIAFTLFLV